MNIPNFLLYRIKTDENKDNRELEEEIYNILKENVDKSKVAYDLIPYIVIEDIEENDYSSSEDNLDIVIERTKKFGVKPMSQEEAVLQMDLLGHDFYMFKDSESDDISIVYRRKNGGYGLIESE